MSVGNIRFVRVGQGDRPSRPGIDARFAASDADGPDGADEDGVAVPLDRFLDRAVDRGDRIGERRCAGRESLPASAFVASLAAGAESPGEAIGDILMMGAEHVDAEMPVAPHHRPG